MRSTTSEWSVRMLADLRGRIDVNAEYQRGVVWSEPQQKLLIDSILRGFDLPKIFLSKLPDGSEFLFEVIDGVQRLTSIWRFLGDEFQLPRNQEYPEIGSVGGKSWSELPRDAKDRLQFSKVTVTELENTTPDAIRELFQRLQQGEPLNAAEKRNAMDVPVRNFVATNLAQHKLWPETGIKKKRFGWHEMCAVALALVRAGGPTGLRGADLQALYDDIEFDSSGEIAIHAVLLLDRLYEVAAVDRGTLRTRWGIVDLLISLMRSDDERMQVSPPVIMRFFQEFEAERRRAAVALSDLRSTVMDLPGLEVDEEVAKLELPDIQLDMLTYVNAFTREGAARDKVAVRSEVMFSRLKGFVADTRDG